MFEVRRAEPGDEPAIRRVCGHGGESVDGAADRPGDLEEPDAPEERDGGDETLNAVPDLGEPGTVDWWFVAVENGTIIGAVAGGKSDDESGEVPVLRVDPNANRQGAATALLNAVTDLQRDEGVEEQWLSVVAEAGVRTEFYRNHGFRVAERRERDGAADVLRMRRRIVDADPVVPDPEAAGVDAPESMIERQESPDE